MPTSHQPSYRDFQHALIIGVDLQVRRQLAKFLIGEIKGIRLSVPDSVKPGMLPSEDLDWLAHDIIFIGMGSDKIRTRAWYRSLALSKDLPPFIFIDEKAELDDAMDMIRLGAADYLDASGLEQVRLIKSLRYASGVMPPEMRGTKKHDHDAEVVELEDNPAQDPGVTRVMPVYVDDVMYEPTQVLPTINTSAPEISREATGVGSIQRDVYGEPPLEEPETTGIMQVVDARKIHPVERTDETVPQDVPFPNNDSDDTGAEDEEYEVEDPDQSGVWLKFTDIGEDWPFTHDDIARGEAYLGHYRIIMFVGLGGMASVFKVRNTLDHQLYALKLCENKPDTDASIPDRFRREYRVLRRIKHPNIVRMYDMGDDEDLYVVMELLPGGDLRSKIRQGISRDIAVSYVVQIAAGLHAAHEQGIIHRDLKPTNILFRADGSLALVDFGIAKRLFRVTDEIDLTREGQMVGTPYYVSPEQATGAAIDKRSDLYSLGVLFYEMLEGHKPFSGKSPLEVMRAHVIAPVPMLSDKYDDLNDVVVQLLAKDPDDRYNGGMEVIRDLYRICPECIDSRLLDQGGDVVAFRPDESVTQIERSDEGTAEEETVALDLSPDAQAKLLALFNTGKDKSPS